VLSTEPMPAPSTNPSGFTSHCEGARLLRAGLGAAAPLEPLHRRIKCSQVSIELLRRPALPSAGDVGAHDVGCVAFSPISRPVVVAVVPIAPLARARPLARPLVQVWSLPIAHGKLRGAGTGLSKKKSAWCAPTSGS